MSTEILEVQPELSEAITVPEVVPEVAAPAATTEVVEFAPVVQEPVIPEVVTEPAIVFEYQPQDDLGRPLGGKQIFKGAGWKEIAEKIASANKEVIKLNRELNRRIRLGDFIPDEIPADVQRSHDLPNAETDPELGLEMAANPKMSGLLLRQQETIERLNAKAESELFLRNTPQYYPCLENFETITSWMIKNNLAPTCENFTFAFQRLTTAGLLLSAPIVREATPAPVLEVAGTDIPANPQPEVVPDNRIIAQEPSQQRRPVGVASGLNRSIAPTVEGTPIPSNKLTVDMVEHMSSTEYKKALRDKAFARAVDALYAAEDARKQAAQQE